MARKNQSYQDGNAFSHIDGTLVIGGIQLDSCTNFSVIATAAITQNVGMGQNPISYGRETKLTEGTMDISQKDAIKLRALSPTGLLIDILPQAGHLLFDNSVGDKLMNIWDSMLFENDGVETATGNTQSMLSIAFKCVNYIANQLS